MCVVLLLFQYVDVVLNSMYPISWTNIIKYVMRMDILLALWNVMKNIRLE